MQRPSRYKILLVLSVLILAGLSCSLPDLSGGTGDATEAVQAESEMLATDTEQPVEEPQAPTQMLPRPTRQEGQPELPKPPIPQPPAQATREPAELQLEFEPPEHEPPDVEGEVAEFYIVNDTVESIICYFYLAYSSDPEWGPDQLGEEDVIYPGETYTLTHVPPGIFDAKAEDCDGNLLAEVYGFDFPDSDTFTLFD